MQLIESIDRVKSTLRPLQRQGLRVAFVPTMGALHEGHLSLVREARARAEVVVASIFVNPTQFGPNEDLDRYPRDLEGDAAQLKEEGVGYVFVPTPALMYPEGFQSRVIVERTTQGLCGAHRPGHFEGVTTVVLKLFSIVRPDVAVFGEKDFQQLAAIRAMVRDLNLDVEVVGAPLVREPDGLAMSSRNAMLSPEERARAVAISMGLFKAKAAYDAGEREGQALVAIASDEMASASLAPEYLELRSFQDLTQLSRADVPSVILTAVPIGSTRLIDNLILRRP